MKSEEMFTTEETIHVHSVLSMVKIFALPQFPLPDHEKVAALRGLMTPEILSAIAKLEADIDRRIQGSKNEGQQ